MVTSKDIAWAAGIYEGEGSSSVPSRKQRQEVVSVTQKEPWLCHRLQELFGGKVYDVRGGKYHRWTLTNANARGFAMTIYGFLSLHRKAQIRTLLAGRQDYVRGPYKGRVSI